MKSFTTPQLFDAYAKVASKANFWGPVAARVHKSEINVTLAAVVFFTGRNVKTKPAPGHKAFFIETC